MNCANHSENPVSAYCQNCGKPLCTGCTRSVSGMVYCEPCLAERLGLGTPVTASGVSIPSEPRPGVAFGLGFIPGVGAFYNGQFFKGIVHVVVFVILIGITEHVGVFGILIAAWVIYQVFDAYHTARARREGLPLPNPFGLNDLGSKLGISNAAPEPGSERKSPENPVAPPSAAVPPPSAASANPYEPYSGVIPPRCAVPPHIAFDPCCSYPPRRGPTAAIVLILLGILFLLNSINFFDFNWFGKLWPVLIIAFGVYLFFDRSHKAPPAPPAEGGLAMNRYLFLRRAKGPAMVVTFGVTALLNNFGVLDYGRSWPLYLLVFGVMLLAERAAFAEARRAMSPVASSDPTAPGSDDPARRGRWATPPAPGVLSTPPSSTSSEIDKDR